MNFFDSQSFSPVKDHRATFSKSLQKNQSGPDFRSVFFDGCKCYYYAVILLLYSFQHDLILV